MSKSTTNPEILDRLLGSLTDTSKRLSNDVEKQAKQIEMRIRQFLDEGEKASDRWMKSIDNEFRAQIDSLRHEVEVLSNRFNEFLGQSGAKPAAKQSAAKAAARTAVKPGATKTPVTKPVTKTAPKAPVTKATARKAAPKPRLAA